MYTDKDRLNNIRQHYVDHHLTPSEHKATGKKPQNTLPFIDIQRIAAFLANYAEENAILLPGRVPGYKCDDIQLLPSSITKKVNTLYNYINLQKAFIPFIERLKELTLYNFKDKMLAIYWILVLL